MAEQRDPVAELTGNFGKWQLQAILIIFLCKIPTSWFMAVILYTAPTPLAGDFSCRPPAHLANHTELQRAAEVLHPTTVGHRELDYCSVYREIYDPATDNLGNAIVNYSQIVVSNRNDTVPCDDFVFNAEFHSVVAEFGLVCGRKFLSAFAQCFHILGLLIGGVLAFYLLKVFSPRRVMLVGMFLQIIFGSMCGLIGVYELHVLFRCLTAITCALMYTSGQMIIADITGGRPKLIVTVLFELFWSIGLILLPAVSMFFSDWSNIYLVISLPTLALVFLHRLIPDSPRWMISMGRLDKAKMILHKAARHNNRVVPKDLDAQLENMAKNPPVVQAAWSQLWQGVSQRRHVILAVHYAWALFILLFNSMVLNIAVYGQKHIHINIVVIAFSEIVGVFVGLYLIMYSRRKWLWTGLMSIATGLFANLAWTIPQHLKDTHIVALTMIPCILIKISTSSSMAVLTTCSPDLVPAELKKTLMFSSAIWARGWFLWAPFIGATSYYGALVPLTVFASMSVVGGLLCMVVDSGDARSVKRVGRKKSVLEVVTAAVEKESFLVRGSISSMHTDLRRVSESLLRRGSICSAQSDIKK